MNADRAADTPLRMFIYEPYPFGKIAGNLRTLLYVLRLAPCSGVRATLAVPFETPLVARARALGAACIVLPAPHGIARFGGQVLRDGWLGRLKTMAGLLRYNATLARLLRGQQDVVYCNSIRTLLTVGLAGRLAGVPLVWYVKGTLENPFLDRLGFVLADRILFFCAANRDDKYPRFVRWYRRKIGVVRIGLDPADIDAAVPSDGSPIRAELKLHADDVAVACVGQLYPPKGVHFLVEAFGRVASEFPRARLILIGDPVIAAYSDYPGKLNAMVDGLGLSDRVVFTGWREDALALVSQMDIVVHPSLAEGFGRAVLEAMALARPVIASRVGGLREAVRDGQNGFLVPPGDVDAIADRLRRLLASSDLRRRMGEQGRQTVLAEYRIDDKVRELYDVCRAAAGMAA